ncbi:hypothetical protein EDC04DRAFT_2892415 [Pisolithus marmoratus]|nr:hypothetical protein EDC04DRAFT_2892415 [Pisolithus marmoratus]
MGPYLPADERENDHNNALVPASREASDSLAGEVASTATLRVVFASLAADVAAMRTDMWEIRQMLSEVRNMVAQALASTAPAHATPTVSCPGTDTLTHCHQRSSTQSQTTTLSPPSVQCVPAAQPHPPTLGLRPPRPVQLPPPGVSTLTARPSQVGPQRTMTHSTSSAPFQGQVIPNVPVSRADGTRTPKADSWKDIVRHWTEGEPRLGLLIPLRDWPHQYYNGRRGRHLNTKYYQRSVVATEFLDEFQGNEDAFLEAYGGAALQGHTRLLKAILDARKQHRGRGERRRHFANDVHGNSATPTVLSATTQQQ